MIVVAPEEPELSDDERRAVARAAAQFNRGLYFECHETLEGVWVRLRGPSRDFFQALIQVSVGFHHLGRGNRKGALGTLTRAVGRFEAYPDRYLGFDVAAERMRLRSLLSALQAQTDPALDRPPVWRFDDLSEVEEVGHGVIGTPGGER